MPFFTQARESFERVRVSVTVNVYLRGMLDALMSITHVGETIDEEQDLHPV